MCVGKTEDEQTAVLMPYYSDDEDCSPSLHPADGLLLVTSCGWNDWEELKGYEGTGYIEFIPEH